MNRRIDWGIVVIYAVCLVLLAAFWAGVYRLTLGA